jgi:hypothetical protein
VKRNLTNIGDDDTKVLRGVDGSSRFQKRLHGRRLLNETRPLHNGIGTLEEGALWPEVDEQEFLVLLEFFGDFVFGEELVSGIATASIGDTVGEEEGMGGTEGERLDFLCKTTKS